MTLATITSEMDHSFDADFREDFNQGMLRMLSQGTSNDVRIILSDGEITANKNVLASQCEYFAANIRWKEQTKDKSDHIEITDCSKEVMERIIKFLFTGSIKFKDFGLLKLLELVNQVRKLLLKGDLQCLIESYIVEDILSFASIKLLRSKCEDIIRGLQYADKFYLDGVRDFILRTNL